ncbi:MAG: hypothetical protein KJ558_13230 [Gammaproteobacteria bacterium]|nr:hypothetical protein [Gammaproteobacteria bacterium]MBU1655761.1 hypothetical protein [Gammaproteobacteria bacterium]MBU1961688.1 hypothetical protein [Gammaproteobacteria bacterium]
MSQTDARRLLASLSTRLPAAQAILITNRFGVELAENISLEGHLLLPALTAATRIFAGRLAEVTGRGQEQYISLYVGESCYSVFEFGEHWIVGILTPDDHGLADLPGILQAAAAAAGPAPGL